jgi:hypothetical protein
MEKERFHHRDLTYSVWHRTESIGRYIGNDRGRQLLMVDIDAIFYVEFQGRTNRPVALVEEARDIGQSHKWSEVIANLAKMAKIPALTVLWRPSATQRNPATGDQYPDIERFRVRPMNMKKNAMGFAVYSPVDYANLLLELRDYQESGYQPEPFRCGCGEWHFRRFGPPTQCWLCHKAMKEGNANRKE